MHIFYLEDIDELRKIFKIHACTAGFTCDCEKTYEDAIKNAIGVKYDALVVDIRLAGNKGGLDFAKEYISIYPETPVYVLTGLDSVVEFPMFVCEPIFRKPVDYSTMFEKIKSGPLKITEVTMHQLIDLLKENICIQKESQAGIKGHFDKLFGKLSDEYLNKVIGRLYRFAIGFIGIITAIVGLLTGAVVFASKFYSPQKITQDDIVRALSKINQSAVETTASPKNK